MRRYLIAYILACAAHGQSAAPVFEVASVKPAAPSGGRVRSSMRGGPGTSDPSRVIFTAVTPMSVILRAYDVKPYQANGPDWMSSERYDVTANVPPGATKEQFNLMLRSLLAERFHLALHHETKELSGYALIRGKSEPKLKQSTQTGPDVAHTEASKIDARGFVILTAPGLAMMEAVRGTAVVTLLTARAQPVSALVEQIGNEFRLPVTDETGLSARYDFTLEVAPQAPGALAPETSNDSAPNLMTAVPEQLGLRLIPSKIPVDVLVIDRAVKVPTEN
jgi:uncharacterized protein (TIGR03435 family)